METSKVDIVCLERANDLSLFKIADKVKESVDCVKEVISKNKVEIGKIRKEIFLVKRKQYEKLYKKAVKSLEEILETPHYVDIFDKKGQCTGQRLNVDILKIKKEVAHELLESIKVKKSAKGGGIHINQQVANVSKGKDKKEAKLIELERNEIKAVLKDCRVEKKELDFIKNTSLN